MLDFSGGAGSGSSTDLLPNGQLAFVVVGFREIKVGPSGGKYIDVELTIDDNQPFARRKVWTRIMDPMDPNNSDGAKQMGMAHIARILEAARWGTQSGPFNEEAFKGQGGYVIGDYADLHGLRAAVKIKVQPARDGYDAKNDVAEFLSPNPKSASFKTWEKLVAGTFNVSANAGQPAAQPSFAFGGGAAQPAQQPSTTGFGRPQGVPQQPVQGAAPFQTAGTHQAAAPTNTPAGSPVNASASHSEGAQAHPGQPAPAFPGGASWLQQAQQGQ